MICWSSCAEANGDGTSGGGGDLVTLASAGGAFSWVNDGVGPNLAIKGATPSTGIGIVDDGVQLTITNTDPGSNVTLASAGGTEPLVSDGVGPALATKGLTPGAGIGLVGAATAVTINNTDPGSNVTLASAGGTESMVNDGVAPSLAIKGLTPGTNITLVATATAITINATGGSEETTYVNDTTTLTTSSNAFVTVATSAGLPNVTNAEVWNLVLSHSVAHPNAVFNYNTEIRWQIEGPAATYTTISQYSICEPMALTIGENGDVRARPVQITAAMNNPTIRLQCRLTLAGAPTTQVGALRVIGFKSL